MNGKILNTLELQPHLMHYLEAQIFFFQAMVPIVEDLSRVNN
jgi:hypothetical protein